MTDFDPYVCWCPMIVAFFPSKKLKLKAPGTERTTFSPVAPNQTTTIADAVPRPHHGGRGAAQQLPRDAGRARAGAVEHARRRGGDPDLGAHPRGPVRRLRAQRRARKVRRYPAPQSSDKRSRRPYSMIAPSSCIHSFTLTHIERVTMEPGLAALLVSTPYD